jgi:type IV pilus assembly protein PilP
MKKTNLIMMGFLLLALTACSGESHSDLKKWMVDQEQKLKGKIEFLPPSKSFTPVPFSAEVDPFVIKEKLTLNNLMKDKYAPDSTRQPEELESFTLDSLRMTGTVIKDGKFYAMILDPNKVTSYVTKGNFLGKNYGQITSISEGEILLEERIKVGDEWTQKQGRVFLYEGTPSGKSR